MPVNADKPHLWKADVVASVDQFNQWFMVAAPQAFRDSRDKAKAEVEAGMRQTSDLAKHQPRSHTRQPHHLENSSDGMLPATGKGTTSGFGWS